MISGIHFEKKAMNYNVKFLFLLSIYNIYGKKVKVGGHSSKILIRPEEGGGIGFS